MSLNLGEAVWRTAGHAFQLYVPRRRKQPGSGQRCILADFLMVAHVVENGFHLLTMGHRLRRAAFPHLAIVTV